MLLEDATNPSAHMVLAITRYKLATHDLVTDLFTLGAGVLATEFLGFGGFNERYARWTIAQADERFALIDRHLATAAVESKVALELCLACWENDWNRNGVIDERDARILQIELDANGDAYAIDDPRRRPTFRPDERRDGARGGVLGAQAPVSFLAQLIRGGPSARPTHRRVPAALPLAEINQQLQMFIREGPHGRVAHGFHHCPMVPSDRPAQGAKVLVYQAIGFHLTDALT